MPMLDAVDNIPPLDPLRAPGRSVEGIGEVLSLERHLSIPELHNTHGVGALTPIGNNIFCNPEIALSNDPPDSKSRWSAGVMAAKRLKVNPTMNYLA